MTIKKQSQISTGIIVNILSKENDSLSDYKEIKCPFCNSEYTHIEKITNNFGDDYPNGSKYKQGSISINFYCEANSDDHKWQFTFGEHKGYVYAEFFKVNI